MFTDSDSDCGGSFFNRISLTPVLSKVLEGFVFYWIARTVMPQFRSVSKDHQQRMLSSTSFIIGYLISRNLEHF